jgi:hypothetical protein
MSIQRLTVTGLPSWFSSFNFLAGDRGSLAGSFGGANMHGLRWVFLLACFGGVAFAAWSGRWEGRLTSGNCTWIMDLGRNPVWAPPPDPQYAQFQEHFRGDFPTEAPKGLTIQRVLKLDWMAADLLLYLWAVTVAFGLLYLAVRGERRDLILHLGLSTGIGLTAGAAFCIGLWMLFGGWGPPTPEFFGGLGLVVGIISGLASFQGSRAEQGAVPDRSPHGRF